jgi:serine/threonine protein kinase
MEDLTGKQLGQYRIVAPLGEGGMAAVYKAYQASVERYVALKILPRHYASDPDFVRRFKREAKVIAGLAHPNILPVHDYGEAEGYTYIVMRYVEGGTLANLLQGQPLPLSQTCYVVSQIAAALDYAHAKGVVHRDVKPSNVLLDEQGNCLLSDFGIAKMIEATGQFTVTGAFIGTPTYASPEQALGQRLDGRSDIYSLGVILYEMTTGRPPFDAETPMAILIKHVHDPLPMPRTVNPALSEPVERVILKALAKGPENRYQTAGEMAQALASAATAEAALPGPEPQPTVAARLRSTEVRRIPVWGWILGGLVILCLIAGLLSGGIALAPYLMDGMATSASVARATATMTLGASSTVANTLPPTLPSSIPTATSAAAEAVTPVSRTWDKWTMARSFPSPGSGPTGVARVGDGVWVIVPGNGRMYHLDLEGNIVAEFNISASQGVGAGLAWDGESLWWAQWNTITQFDPATGTESTQFETEVDVVEGIAWDGAGLWLVDREGNLVQYDRAGQRLRRLGVPVSPSGATGLAWAEGEIWVEDMLGEVERFDSDFDLLGSFDLSQCGVDRGTFYSLALCWDGESLWLADPDGNRIYQCIPGD